MLTGIAAIGVTATQASGLPHANPMSGLVSAIATKFHLNQADVQQVFDAERTQQQADMQAKFAADQKTRLDAAVTAGKLTQAQEDLIIAKQAEIKTFMDTLKDKTPADRKTAMQTEMTTMTQWAKDQSIPQGFIGLGGGFGRGGHGFDGARPSGGMGMMGRGHRGGQPPAPVTP